MPIPSFENPSPFDPYNGRFHLSAHRHVGPFQRGDESHGTQEGQWAEQLDLEGRLDKMPAQYVLINNLLRQGWDPKDICHRLRITKQELYEARAWLRENPPDPGYGDLDVTV